jgi:uncharacterized protein (TIGR03083 family)
MDRDTTWRHVIEQRHALAGILATLTPAEWEHPSLCAGWRVRDVAAHVIATPQLGWRDLPGLLLRGRGSYNRAIDVDTRRRGRAEPAEILRQFATYADSRHLAPLTGPLEPLIDVLVHTQDMLRPLGRHHAPPIEAAVAAADRCRGRDSLVLGSRRLVRAVRMVATDVDWDRGRGPVVEAPMVELLMLCAGRAPSRDRLAGAGVGLLAQA